MTRIRSSEPAISTPTCAEAGFVSCMWNSCIMSIVDPGVDLGLKRLDIRIMSGHTAFQRTVRIPRIWCVLCPWVHLRRPSNGHWPIGTRLDILTDKAWLTWPPGEMASRLTTNQEIAGSTPAVVITFEGVCMVSCRSCPWSSLFYSVQQKSPTPTGQRAL